MRLSDRQYGREWLLSRMKHPGKPIAQVQPAVQTQVQRQSKNIKSCDVSNARIPRSFLVCLMSKLLSFFAAAPSAAHAPVGQQIARCIGALKQRLNAG